jgi:hypothetical protein
VTWGTRVEVERRDRIRLAVAAYAYEIADAPIMSDADFDRLAWAIDRQTTTGHPVYDEFFLAHFTPHTGMWVRLWPDLPSLKRLYEKHYRRKT